MVSKRELGVSYFLGLGLGLVVSLLGYLALVGRTSDVVSVGAVSAVVLAGSLPYVGYWLRASDFSDTAVWRVACWCAVGVGIPTFVATLLMVANVRPTIVFRFPHLLVNFVAAGAVLGTGLGLIRELRKQYDQVEELNRRNEVLNRAMRHDIRNDVTVIEGRLRLLAQEHEDLDEELLTAIERKSKEIAEVSHLAKHIQSLDTDAESRPVDVVTLLEDCVEGVRETHPAVDLATDLPEKAWVDTGEQLRIAVGNLVENAIEHNDREPEVAVAVERGEDAIRVTVADNGPGIPTAEREMLLAEETPASASNTGLGLWLVRWFVDHYDGTLDIAANDPRGTRVTIELPAATSPATTRPPAG
jgi:two-component system OmpR family sensor kinase